MIDIDEINAEIARLEKSECTTYPICEKLAILYTVREHMTQTTKMSSPSPSPMMSPAIK